MNTVLIAAVVLWERRMFRSCFRRKSALLLVIGLLGGSGGACSVEEPMEVREVSSERGQELRPDEGPARELIEEFVPTLHQFSLVTLNPRQLLSLAQRGARLRLPFPSEEGASGIVGLPVDLRPLSLVAPEARGYVISGDGELASAEPVALGDSREYEGEVAGSPDGVVVLSLTPERVLGSIVLPTEFRGVSGWFFIEPLGPLLRENGASQEQIEVATRDFNHVVYASSGVRAQIPLHGMLGEGQNHFRGNGRDSDQSEAPRLDEPGGHPGDAGGAPEANDLPTPEVREKVSLYLMADEDFYAAQGSARDVFNAQKATVLGVELITHLGEPGIYGHQQFDIELEIVGQSVWGRGGPQSTDSAIILEESYNGFPWYIVPTPVQDIGLVHLFTGKDIDGSVIGRAWKIGGFDDPCGEEYSTGSACRQSMSQPEFSGSNFYLKVILMAHELGHVMDGVHSDFDSSYSMGSLVGPSIMQSFISGGQLPYFSRTNASAIGSLVASECAGDPC